MACSLISVAFVAVKAWCVFGEMMTSKGERAMEMGLFICSLFLGVAHIVVAYRGSCRERRKLRVYEIDIEAVRISIFCFKFKSNFEIMLVCVIIHFFLLSNS